LKVMKSWIVTLFDSSKYASHALPATGEYIPSKRFWIPVVQFAQKN
jgi:hypothetical protein